jgi:Arc/MetJ family transcription regulator
LPVKRRSAGWKQFFAKPPLDVDFDAIALRMTAPERIVNFDAGLRYNTHKEVYMRTNIVLDDKLVKDAMKASGAKTKREVVSLGLRELLRVKAQKNLLDLRGLGLIDPAYDYKKARAGR